MTRSAALVKANTGQKAELVEINKTQPVERPEQMGAALAGLSAALIGAVEDADDVSLEIDAGANGIRYRFRAYKRSTS